MRRLPLRLTYQTYGHINTPFCLNVKKFFELGKSSSILRITYSGIN